MFCAIYEFKVKPEKEERFRAAWRLVTEQMLSEHHSMGARLHRSDAGILIAYAQWPDRERWQLGHDLIIKETTQLHLDDCLEDMPKILLQLTVLDDLLHLTASDSYLTTSEQNQV